MHRTTAAPGPPREGPSASGRPRVEAQIVPHPIPDHDLLQLIGRGSYGEVWLARTRLGTLRAVKIVHRDSSEDGRPFEREFQGIRRFEPVSRSHDGLVHRDVKPSNVIFVGGVAKLADIGLVAAMDEAHAMVGTPSYVPPEGAGTPAADVFSLGKVLYELSTGKDRRDFPQLPPDLRAFPDAEALVELNEVLLWNARRHAQAMARQLYVAETSLGYQAWEGGHLNRANELLEAQRPRLGRVRPFESGAG